jgi:hypothetical protein
MSDKKCLHCDGTGKDVCSACDGKKKVGGFLGLGGKSCPMCEGSGVSKCQHCGGSGEQH